MKIRKYLIIFIMIMLPACTASQRERLANIGMEPKVNDVDNPIRARERNPIKWFEEDEDDVVLNSNSLWQPGSSTFFKDQKPRQKGDILKVNVQISDRAELDNRTVKDRRAKEDGLASTVMGLEKLAVGWAPGKANPANLFEIDMSNSNEGGGTIDRAEVIETEIAAMVTQILPNGNIVIHGSQEIRINHELRQIMVDGIVRPEDISADNSIDSNQIAEARISYGGKGALSELQQPRIGHQIIDIISPF